MKSALLWSGLLAGLASATPVLAQQGDGYYGHHMWNGGGPGWFLGPVMMIFFVAIAVVGVVLLVRWLGGSPHRETDRPAPRGKTSMDILKERFARGEIDREEFEERRRVLED